MDDGARERGAPEALARRTLDTLPVNVAVLEADGTIVYTNRSWRTFAVDNDLAGDPDSVGTNYLAVCDRAVDEPAGEAAAGIRAVLAGERDVFTLEYPCHGPDERRWFLLRVSRFGEASRRHAVVAHSDITERKLAELEVEATADALEEERETLALLNQVVRHDIRNEMSVVVGWARSLRERLDDEGRAVLDRIVRSAEHVLDLTETVGDLADALSGDGDPDLEPVELGPVLRDELETVENAHAGGPDDVTVVAPDEVPDVPVLADGLLSSVFANLLNNAVLHNDASDPRVEVTVETGDDAVVVEVADDGPGIPPDRREAVFGRGEAGLESPGAGLGLYLVDTLVDRYGGAVEIRDNEPSGTVFRVTLRRA